MKQIRKKDLCETCEHHWIDFPLPLEYMVSHCTIADSKGSSMEKVPFPCEECPFNCYSKNKEL